MIDAWCAACGAYLGGKRAGQGYVCCDKEADITTDPERADALREARCKALESERDEVPLSVKDPTAQDLLWEYAHRRRSVDEEFADDLEVCLRATGYEPVFHRPSSVDIARTACGLPLRRFPIDRNLQLGAGETCERCTHVIAQCRAAASSAAEALASCVKDGVLQMRDVDRAQVYSTHLGKGLRKKRKAKR
jgi:hypothetical protein